MTDPAVIFDLQQQLWEDPTQEHLWLILADAFDEYPAHWQHECLDTGPVIAQRIRNRVYTRFPQHPTINPDHVIASRAGLGTCEFISCTMQSWMWKGKRFLEVYPHIRRVRIKDRKPFRSGGAINPYTWWQQGRYSVYPNNNPDLPADILKHVRALSDISTRELAFVPFNTCREARRALSEACLKWARGK